MQSFIYMYALMSTVVNWITAEVSIWMGKYTPLFCEDVITNPSIKGVAGLVNKMVPVVYKVSKHPKAIQTWFGDDIKMKSGGYLST